MNRDIDKEHLCGWMGFAFGVAITLAFVLMMICGGTLVVS